MAARLQPERLGPSPEANSGAPVVGPDNVVESGNGRTLAIGKAYDAGQGDAYRQHLESFGYNTSSFDKPVLVARRVTPMSPDQRETGARKVGDLINDALLDPEQCAALMAQAPLKPDTGSASTLAYQLRRASMYGGDAMTRVTTHLATRAPRLADRADDERRQQQPDDRSARARGGGLFGGGGGLLGSKTGGGPIGVPTFAQTTGSGVMAAKAPFAAGGSVKPDSVEDRARSFMDDLQATSAALKERSKQDALIASFGPRDPIAEAIAMAGGRRRSG